MFGEALGWTSNSTLWPWNRSAREIRARTGPRLVSPPDSLLPGDEPGAHAFDGRDEDQANITGAMAQSECVDGIGGTPILELPE